MLERHRARTRARENSQCLSLSSGCDSGCKSSARSVVTHDPGDDRQKRISQRSITEAVTPMDVREEETQQLSRSEAEAKAGAPLQPPFFVFLTVAFHSLQPYNKSTSTMSTWPTRYPPPPLTFDRADELGVLHLIDRLLSSHCFLFCYTTVRAAAETINDVLLLLMMSQSDDNLNTKVAHIVIASCKPNIADNATWHPTDNTKEASLYSSFIKTGAFFQIGRPWGWLMCHFNPVFKTSSNKCWFNCVHMLFDWTSVTFTQNNDSLLSIIYVGLSYTDDLMI